MFNRLPEPRLLTEDNRSKETASSEFDGVRLGSLKRRDDGRVGVEANTTNTC